jgi:hypothetical protein
MPMYSECIYAAKAESRQAHIYDMQKVSTVNRTPLTAKAWLIDYMRVRGLIAPMYLGLTNRPFVTHHNLLESCRFAEVPDGPQSYIIDLLKSTGYVITLCTNRFNLLTPKLNPAAQRCLTRYFTWDFASWTVHFVNVCVKTQQMLQLFIQFINYVS